jgi:hypothetical protein
VKPAVQRPVIKPVTFNEDNLDIKTLEWKTSKPKDDVVDDFFKEMEPKYEARSALLSPDSPPAVPESNTPSVNKLAMENDEATAGWDEEEDGEWAWEEQ